MTWNYRIIDRGEDHDAETRFALFEVFYDCNGKPETWTEEPASVEASSPEALKREFELFAEALELPVLAL